MLYSGNVGSILPRFDTRILCGLAQNAFAVGFGRPQKALLDFGGEGGFRQGRDFLRDE